MFTLIIILCVIGLILYKIDWVYVPKGGGLDD